MFAGKLKGDRLQGTLGLGRSYSRFQPAHRKEVVGIPRFEPGATDLDLTRHHHRHKKVGGKSYFCTDEALSHHPDNHKGAPIKRHTLADNVLISSETILPTAVAHHHHRMRVRGLIFFRTKAPT